MVFIKGIQSFPKQIPKIVLTVHRQLLPGRMGASSQQRRSLSSSSLPVVDWCESLITATHSNLGLPWWLSIALSTLAIRGLITLPLQLKLQARIQRFKSTQSLLKAWKATLQNKSKIDTVKSLQLHKPSSNRQHIQQDSAIQFKNTKKRLYKEYQCGPLGSIALVGVQLPIFLCMSFAIRNLIALELPWIPLSGGATSAVPGMTTGGILWFEDLTIPDPTWISPIILSSLTYINTLVHPAVREKAPSWLRRAWAAFPLHPALMFFLSCHAPMALSVYWITSAGYSLISNLAFLKLGWKQRKAVPWRAL